LPGCERRHDLHAHHIKHWADGGATREQNLVLLCRFHHRLVHEDEFSVRLARDGMFQFNRRDRRRIPHAPIRLEAPHRPRGQPVAA